MYSFSGIKMFNKFSLLREIDLGNDDDDLFVVSKSKKIIKKYKRECIIPNDIGISTDEILELKPITEKIIIPNHCPNCKNEKLLISTLHDAPLDDATEIFVFCQKCTMHSIIKYNM